MHTVLKHKLMSTFITDKKISELERLRNKINSNSDSHSSASSTTSSSCSTSTSAAQSKVNTSRYKTELCRPFSEHGTCKYGEKCQFAHGQAELRSVTRHPKYKTDLCKTYHSVGFCPYGPRCHFVHNLDEVTNGKQMAAPYLAGVLGVPEHPRNLGVHKRGKAWFLLIRV